MRKIEELQIHFVDMSHYTCEVLKDYFGDCENVKIHHTDLKRFFYEHSEIDCLVSPANAFGKMTGGYDAALSEILGWDFQKKVQQYIKDHFYGEQGVATSFYIETDIPGVSLIHTPTMQYPSVIRDSLIVYYCMRSTLICALEHDVKTIVIPVFGGSSGQVEPEIAGQRLYDAYKQIMTRAGAKYDF